MEEDSSTPSASSSQSLLRRASSGPESRVAVLLGRAAGLRGGPQALVRQSAALHLEERRADWAHSRLMVALGIAWNLALAVVSAETLFLAVDEEPAVPIMVWVGGYAVLCVVHVALAWTEYRRRRNTAAAEGERGRGGSVGPGGGGCGSSTEESEEDGRGRSNQRSSFAKRCEDTTTIASFLWWIIGFYWMISGGNTLMQDAPSPRLYWVAVTFLALDVLYAIFCFALFGAIVIALSYCLPFFISFLDAIAPGQKGASARDISMLPRYRYVQTISGGVMIHMPNNSGSSTDEQVLVREDANCCICLESYKDGVELHSLPCDHHFHAKCIGNWLRINPTCPLCKYNILERDNDQPV